MTEQERTILKGMYAAGFRYVVRDEEWILFGSDKFKSIGNGAWVPKNPEKSRVTDLDTMVDELFGWIKADDKEPVEIADIIETEE
ncbi:hypothetical protein IMSAG049_01130 [Clostridiales bacterium]|nr:hypothetical protein IMSAG049_01130 [Clostridiales bacterium]